MTSDKGVGLANATGSRIFSDNGLGVIGPASGNAIAAGAGNLLIGGRTRVNAAGGGNLLSDNGLSLIGLAGGNLIGVGGGN